MVMEVGVSDTTPIDPEMIYRMVYTKTKRPERGAVSSTLAGQKICHNKLSTL